MGKTDCQRRALCLNQAGSRKVAYFKHPQPAQNKINAPVY